MRGLAPRTPGDVGCKYVLPNLCQVEVLPTASHWVYWDEPTTVVERWRRFVRELAPVAETPVAGPA